MLVHLHWYTKKKAALALNAILIIFILATVGIHLQVLQSFDPSASPDQQISARDAIKTIEIVNTVKKGDTIIDVLKKEGLDQQTAYQFFTEVKPVFDLQNISVGKKYTLFLNEDTKELVRFRYEIDPARTLIVNKEDDGDTYKSECVTIPYVTKNEFINGTIQDSLFGSITDMGEKPELADMMASLYEYDIDFNRDIRKQDNFSLMVEKMYLNGQFIRYGNILASEFTNRGKTIKLIRFTDKEGVTAYYHPDGRSAKKMFLRCPLPFMRVTSSFGNRRHPLLGFSKQHNGIDLGAPTGTPIKAVGSGIIKDTGYSSSKGRFIAILHKNQYTSHYYHLSRIENGIKSGARVEQSQIIGYVGSTGWSTGPHLHYGLQKGNAFLNPLNLQSPMTEPVKGIYLAEFNKYASNMLFLLQSNKLVKIPPAITAGLVKPGANSKPTKTTMSSQPTRNSRAGK